MKKPKLQFIAEYRGWIIEKNFKDAYIASKADLSVFPQVAFTLDGAKRAVDSYETQLATGR